jgi:hypothetical protein
MVKGEITMHKNIYIAGKITGLENFKEKFEAAETDLKERGFIPMNPAKLNSGFSHAEYMHICYAMIDICDSVYMLLDWEESKGAVMEYNYAVKNHKEIIREEIKANEIKDGDCLYYSKVEKNKNVHELKTLRKYFDAVCDGQKTFEVRKDDRNFQVGDILRLQRYENEECQKANCNVTITYILGRNEDEKMFVPDGYVIVGIK